MKFEWIGVVESIERRLQGARLFCDTMPMKNTCRLVWVNPWKLLYITRWKLSIVGELEPTFLAGTVIVCLPLQLCIIPAVLTVGKVVVGYWKQRNKKRSMVQCVWRHRQVAASYITISYTVCQAKISWSLWLAVQQALATRNWDDSFEMDRHRDCTHAWIVTHDSEIDGKR